MLGFATQIICLLNALSRAGAARYLRDPHFVGQEAGGSDEPAEVEPVHQLGIDKDGILSLLQMHTEEARRAAMEVGTETATGLHLFKMQINMDIEAMDTGGGITVVFDKAHQQLALQAGMDGVAGIAWGAYSDQISSNGWSFLSMWTTPSQNVQNDVKMYAAGYIEGVLTSVRLSQYHANYHHSLLRAEKTWHALSKIRTELSNVLGFLKIKCNFLPRLMAEESKTKYWRHARYLTFQLFGLQEGFNYVANHFNVHTLSLVDLMFLNAGGEMATLMMAFAPAAMADRAKAQAPGFLQMGMYFRKLQGMHAKLRAAKHLHAAYDRYEVKHGLRPNTTNKTRLHGFADFQDLPTDFLNTTLGPESLLQGPGSDSLDDLHWEARMAYDGHCSAFVRVAAGNAEMYTAHNTWADYTQMTRIWKYYSFPIANGDTMATTQGFSSYPGCLSSMDDYYTLDSGLVVMDTTLEILDPFIWDHVLDSQISFVLTAPNWMHIMIANKMAKTPQHWVNLYDIKNSGTYNVQWMVVDYNNFVTGKEVPDNLFWVLETIPSMSHAEDMSHRLRSHGYWGAYNRPYFTDIREKTKFNKAQKKLGNLYSWEDNPRAVIFKGLAGLNGLADMKNMIYRNLYPNAGISPNTPGHEISARFDISPMTAFPNGGIDAKVTCKSLVSGMKSQLVSGPVSATVPAFTWKNPDGSERWPGYAHVGQPDTWKFGWIQISPNGVMPCDIACR